MSPLLSFRLSFYSGHSSFSMYCMLFLAVSTCLRDAGQGSPCSPRPHLVRGVSACGLSRGPPHALSSADTCHLLCRELLRVGARLPRP